MADSNTKPRSMTPEEFALTRYKWASYFYRQAVKTVERSFTDPNA